MAQKESETGAEHFRRIGSFVGVHHPAANPLVNVYVEGARAGNRTVRRDPGPWVQRSGILSQERKRSESENQTL